MIKLREVNERGDHVKISSTPYDDVFRTMLNDCSSLILPVLNEIFGEHYTGEERIEFGINEHYMNQQDGEEEKRVTDSIFRVFSDVVRKFHAECQSTPDHSLLLRFFEYDSQDGLDDAEIIGDTLVVTFPQSCVLYLRHTSNTPDRLKTKILTPGGDVTYEIPVMKLQSYSLDEIFDKNLIFLLPFYIFLHESRFSVYNEDEAELEKLQAEFEEIKRRLEELQNSGKITEFTKCTIEDMSNKVLQHLALEYENVREGVKKVMGGRILQYEAKDILNQGRDEGRNEKGIEIVEKMLRKGKMTIEEIADYSDMTEKEVEAIAERIGVLAVV